METPVIPAVDAPDGLGFGTLETVFEALGRALIVLDAEFRIIRASHTLDEIAGTGMVASVIGKPIEDLVGAKLFGPTDTLREALTGGQREELRRGERPSRLAHGGRRPAPRLEPLRPAGALPRGRASRRGRGLPPPEHDRVARPRRALAGDEEDRSPRRVAPPERRDRPHHGGERDRQGGHRAGAALELDGVHGAVRPRELRRL